MSEQKATTGVSKRYGRLKDIRELPDGRYLATMDDDAFLPGVSSTFDRDDVTLDDPTTGAALAVQPCIHEWTDARNAVVMSGEVCFKCGAIRAQEGE